MTEKMIENRLKKLKALEEQMEQLQNQAEEIKNELKTELEVKGLEELKMKNFLIRWKKIVSNRLDSKALKETLPEIYNQYCRPVNSQKFTIVY